MKRPLRTLAARSVCAPMAVLTFFGFTHSEAIDIGKMPMVAVSYLVVAVTLFACAKYAAVSPKPAAAHGEGHGHGALDPA